MNEQLIGDLFAEATQRMTGSSSKEFSQKFAELIVRECVGIVDKIVPPGYADYPDYRDQIEQAFRRECATEIKLHFGVEE
jgi:hypothetical protein